MSIEKIIYRAKAKATGGCDGRTTSSDGVLDVKLGLPKEMGGQGGAVTNPEQLFTAGYSACFLGALKHVAAQAKIPLSSETFIKGTVGIGAIATGFAIEVRLEIYLPWVERSVAEDLVQKTHVVCPYSNATRNNIDVSLQVITA
ncbi:organic hydroperoxide resistance protein [Sodalis-like symbiont of Bactericera trigonica]|nr:organic hydroperoxide resistance protein [Sodalis-like symbiont of Bactericera trigonica]